MKNEMEGGEERKQRKERRESRKRAKIKRRAQEIETYTHTCKKRVIHVIYHRNFFWIFRKILG